MTPFGEWFTEQALKNFDPSQTYSKIEKKRDEERELKAVIMGLSVFAQNPDSEYHKEIVLSDSRAILGFLRELYKLKFGGDCG